MGVLATALLAPVVTGALVTPRRVMQVVTDTIVSDLNGISDLNEKDVCELVTASAQSAMHQSYGEDEEEWWTCPGMALEANCREIFYDGEVQVYQET